MLEALPSPGVRRVTLTVDEVESRCPVDGEGDISEVVVSFAPNGWTLEAGSLVTWLMGFARKEITSEELADAVADAVVGAISPKYLTVVVRQRPAPSCLLTVEATRP